MAVDVKIPYLFRELSAGKDEVRLEAAGVAEAVDELEKEFPGMKAKICDEGGNLRRFINLYVNDEDVRFLKGQSTELKDGDVMTVLPMIAGG